MRSTINIDIVQDGKYYELHATNVQYDCESVMFYDYYLMLKEV